MNDLLKTAMDAALRAGDAILQIYARDFEVEFKADESPLTEADKAAHCIICDALEDTGLPILSEESKAIAYEERKDWTKYWLVDPLDGTKEFIKKNGEFTVNIALVENGRPVMGVVYAPVLRTIYYGSKAEDSEQKTEDGAWKVTDCAEKSVDEIVTSAVLLSPSSVLRPPAVAKASPFAEATEDKLADKPSSVLRVVASRSHCNDETRAFIQALEEKYGAAELVSSGSSLKLCLVAEGSADVYPRIAPTMEWDTAAAQAVVEAAGRRVVQYDAEVAPADYLPGFNGLNEAGLSAEALAKEEGRLNDLRCNKPDLLNPYFVVC